jgi:DNA-binding NarL/FixJ family response regulator
MTETGPPVGVVVVDDQAPFRRAARAVGGATSGFELVAEAASAEEAVELARSLEPDLVLLDIHMPGIGGIEASRRIAGFADEAVTVLLSSY